MVSEWLDEEVWKKGGFVVRVNALLRDEEYEEEAFWKERSGLPGEKGVEELWEEYRGWLKERNGKDLCRCD